MMFNYKRALLVGVAIPLAGLMPPQAAFSQALKAVQDQKVFEEIVVTGTRISSGSAEDSISPLQIVTAEEINDSGVVNIQDLLLKNPVFGTPGISRTNSAFAVASFGTATIDLRNLGSDRTLVLVDGRRFVAGIPGTSTVDLNSIPSPFIERVDILTGGASSVYGSDAVAGVVNFIYKKNFEGVSVEGQSGQSDQGDDQQTQIGMTFGANSPDGRGNVMAYLGYTRQGAVYSRDRDRSAVDQLSLALLTGDPAEFFTPEKPFYSSFAPQGRFFTAEGPESGYTFNTAGELIDWNTNGTGPLATGATGFNRSAFRTIALPLERYLIAARGSYEFVENQSAFFEANFASTTADTSIEPFPLGSEDIYPSTGGQVPMETLVDGVIVRNPFVPDEIYDTAGDEDGDGLKDYYFSKRMADFGPRSATAERSTFRLVGGFEGLIRGSWNYNTFYSFGQTSESQVNNGQVNVLNFRFALDAIPSADGGVICADANAVAQGCQPANVFGYNSLSPGAVAYINAPSLLSTLVTQKNAGLNVEGDIWDLPAGALSVAIGGEYRGESSRSEFDALTATGLNGGNKIPPTEGSFDSIESYLEVRVPLLAKLPGAELLTVTGAIRSADYSTVGNTLSWNAGLEWAPVSDLRFRITRSLSTRAPNIDELFAPPGQTFPDVTDPCDGVTNTTPGPTAEACRSDPSVQANIDDNGGVFTQTQSDLQGVSGFNVGNPDVQEEKGKSWTVGAVFTPSDIPVLDNVTFTVDYYRINIEDAIVSTPRDFVLNQCYGGDPSFCSFITRRQQGTGQNNIGTLEFVDSAVSNSGGVFAEGVDVTVNYFQDIGPGTLTASLAYTHLLDGYLVPLPDSEKDFFAGEIGASDNRAYLNMGYSWSQFSATVQTTYIGSASLDDTFLAGFTDAGGNPLARDSYGIGSVTYVDAQFSYNPLDAWQLYLGINNLFDREPPPVINGLPGDSTGTETDAGTYDPIGRRWYAGVRVKF